MGGPTPEQTQIDDMQIQAYKQALDLTQKQYGNQQAIFAPMAKQFMGILSKGPNARGFSDAEHNDLLSTSVEGTAENYAAASRATGEAIASRGGGSNVLPSGSDAELQAETARSAAREQSREQTQIEGADYQQGFQQWLNAGQGLMTIGAGENPLGYESASTSSGSAAASTAKDIADEQNGWINAAIGAAGSIASKSKYLGAV